jgi:branched-chain amino acid transport system permease protein
MVVGVLVAPVTFAYANLGNLLVLPGFIAMIVGGQGSYRGALVAGISMGIIGQFAARYLGPNFQDLTLFGVLLVILMIKPSGLFGRQLERAV